MEEKEGQFKGESASLFDTIANQALAYAEEEAPAGKLLVFHCVNASGKDLGFGRITVPNVTISPSVLFDLMAAVFPKPRPGSLVVTLTPKALGKLKAIYQVQRHSEELLSILEAVRLGTARVEEVAAGK